MQHEDHTPNENTNRTELVEDTIHIEENNKPETKAHDVKNPNAANRANVRINNDAFLANPLIQQMANIPQWTLSDKDKKPINSRLYIQTGEMQLFKQRTPDDLSALTSLHQINTIPELDHINRAFRFDGNEYRRNPFICIDIESRAPESVVQYFMQMPVHYAEYSRSGGFHLLIEVPGHCIDPEMNYLFNTTVIENERKEFEFILNRHFCTFTKKVIPTREPDFSTPDTNDSQTIKALLQNILKMDAKNAKRRQEKREATIKRKEAFDTNNLPRHVIKLANIVPSDYIEKLHKLSPDDYVGDKSRYEFNLATKLVGKMYRMIELNKDPMLGSKFGKPISELDAWDYAYACHYMLEQMVPEREKHEGLREGLPWLLFISRDAAFYIDKQFEDKKQNK